MKSFSGSCETEAYVFLISLFRTSTSISTSTAIAPPSFGKFVHSALSISLGDRGGPKRWPRLPGCRGNEQAAGAGERGDDHDRRSRRGRVGAETGDQGAEDEAEVAPEAIHADHACPVARLARVRDGRAPSRVDQRGAGPEQHRSGERRSEGAVAGDEQAERTRLDDHPGRDQRLSARVVGEPAGR